eukprot:gene23675-32049_t
MTNRYDQYRSNKGACLQGLSVNSNNVAFSVNKKYSKDLQTNSTKIPDTKVIFGEGSFYTSDFSIQRRSKLEDNSGNNFPTSRGSKRDDASISVSTSSSYQFPVLKSSAILNPSQQKAIAAIELMKNYNKLSGTDVPIANNAGNNNRQRVRSPTSMRKNLSSSTPNLKSTTKTESTIKIPKLLKEEISTHSANVAASRELLSNNLLDNSPSLGSLHEIQGLNPSKSIIALPVKLLAFDDSDTEKGSPSKEKLHNFLSKLSSPTAAASSLTSTPANRLQGRGLTKNSSTRIAQSPSKSTSDLNIPLQLRASTVLNPSSSNPGSVSPSREEERARLASTNIVIPMNKTNLATENGIDDEVELAQASNEEEPQAQVRFLSDESHNSSSSPSMESSLKRKKSAGQKKRVAYVLSPDNLHSASISLEMSSVPKSEDLTQPQDDGQGSAVRKSSKSRRHHDNTDNFSIGSTEGELSVNSGDLSTLDIDYNNNNNSSEEVQLPYQIHRRMMGWKLTNPSRRRDLIGMLDIVHKQSPVDLLMGGSRIQNETLERRSREYEVNHSGSRRRKANLKKISSLKKLEQQIQYLQDYEKHASTYASAAPGSPLYYLDEVIHSAQQKSMEYGDINKESEAAFDHDLRVRALSPTSMRRQSRAWEQNVNRMLKIRRAFSSVTAIKRLVEEKKKRQGKLEELTAGTGALSGGGSRFGHSALMESIERFEKMSFSDFCDDLDDEEYEGGGEDRAMMEGQGENIAMSGLHLADGPPGTRSSSRGRNAILPPVRPFSRPPNSPNASPARQILTRIGRTLSPQFRVTAPLSPPFKVSTKNLSPLAKAKIMKKQVYDYPVGVSSTRSRMDIIDSVQARISLESSEIKTERRNLSTAEAKARQRKETKWFSSKPDVKPLHQLTMRDDEDRSIGNLDEVMLGLLKELNS